MYSKCLGIFVVFLIGIGCCGSSNPPTGTSGTSVAPQGQWTIATGNLYTGVKLYYGEKKTYIGQILGGNNKYRDPDTHRVYRGIKLKMKSGNIEWKSRNAISKYNGGWYVKRADPAIAQMNWQTYRQ